MLLSALIVWGGWTLWAMSGRGYQHLLAPLELSPQLGSWRVLEGEGFLVEGGFTITRPGLRGRVRIAVELPEMLDAERFYKIEVHAGDYLPHALMLGWSRSETFQSVGSLPVENIDDKTGELLLGAANEWRDGIYFLDLEQQGFSSGQWTLQSIRLHYHPLDFYQSQRLIWRSFLPPGGWVQRNPHFIWPADERLRISPVLSIAMWIALSVVMMLVMGLARSRQILAWCGLPVLIGWLILDVRWQAELLHKAHQTYTAFAGKSINERFSSDIDGEFFDFLHELRSRHERDEFDRVFAFSTQEFWRKRARYHLSTWRVREAASVALTPALSGQLRSGDLILLLDAPEVIIDSDSDTANLTTLDGQALLTGQLLLQRREWAAVRIL